MAVGYAKNLEEPLERAVLAGPAMEHVECHIRLGRRQRRGDVRGDIKGADAVTAPDQRFGTGFAGTQRHLAFGRPSPHQNGDVLGHSSASLAAPSH